MARSLFLMTIVMIPGFLEATTAFAAASPGPVAAPGPALAEQVVRPETVFAGAPIADEAHLNAATGMADIKVVQQTVNVANTGTVAGNIINGDPVTGAISFDGGSFGGFNGLALVNTNTGNNVSINAAMNVNVAIQQ